jgi:hypothetical protein
MLRLILGALAIGGIAYAFSSPSKADTAKYRIQFLESISPTERTEFYENKADAISDFKEHVKYDSYVSLEERIGKEHKWKDLK